MTQRRLPVILFAFCVVLFFVPYVLDCQVEAYFATPFVDTGSVGEITEGRCWLAWTNGNEKEDAFLVIVSTDTLQHIVLHGTARKGIVQELMWGKPVIVKAKILEKEYRSDDYLQVILEVLSVKESN